MMLLHPWFWSCEFLLCYACFPALSSSAACRRSSAFSRLYFCFFIVVICASRVGIVLHIPSFKVSLISWLFVSFVNASTNICLCLPSVSHLEVIQFILLFFVCVFPDELRQRLDVYRQPFAVDLVHRIALEGIFYRLAFGHWREDRLAVSHPLSVDNLPRTSPISTLNLRPSSIAKLTPYVSACSVFRHIRQRRLPRGNRIPPSERSRLASIVVRARWLLCFSR